jgi:hypothetical protein
MFNFIFSLVSDFSSCSPMEEAVAVANAEDGSKEFCVGKKPIGEVVRKDTSEEQKDEGVDNVLGIKSGRSGRKSFGR